MTLDSGGGMLGAHRRVRRSAYRYATRFVVLDDSTGIAVASSSIPVMTEYIYERGVQATFVEVSGITQPAPASRFLRTPAVRPQASVRVHPMPSAALGRGFFVLGIQRRLGQVKMCKMGMPRNAVKLLTSLASSGRGNAAAFFDCRHTRLKHHQLRAHVEIVEHSSLRAAARVVCLSQPMLDALLGDSPTVLCVTREALRFGRQLTLTESLRMELRIVSRSLRT